MTGYLKKRAGILVLGLVFVGLAVSASPKTGNGIPAEARPEVARAVEDAARRPHPRLFADARGFAELEKVGYKGNYVIEREGGDNRAAEIGLAAERLLK